MFEIISQHSKPLIHTNRLIQPHFYCQRIFTQRFKNNA